MFRALSQCCGRRRDESAKACHVPVFEKFAERYQDHPICIKEEAAFKELEFIAKSAQGSPKQLCMDIHDKVREAGWWDDLQAAVAEKLFFWLECEVKVISNLSEPLKKAFDTAFEQAKKIPELAVEFAKEHPILTAVVCAVVVLGILAIIWPDVLELLGFELIGPRLGSFAARWQSWYPNVPAGSLFSYLQRLGMTVASG